MGKITSFPKDWNNGQTMYEADYEQDREIIRVAVNDNYDRLIKQYTILDGNDADKSVQTLTDVLNTIRFKEGSNIVLYHDPVTSTITINASGELSPTLSDGQVITSKLADSAVTTVKIANGAVTADKVSSEIAKQQEVRNMQILSLWGGW